MGGRDDVPDHGGWEDSFWLLPEEALQVPMPTELHTNELIISLVEGSAGGWFGKQAGGGGGGGRWVGGGPQVGGCVLGAQDTVGFDVVGTDAVADQGGHEDGGSEFLGLLLG